MKCIRYMYTIEYHELLRYSTTACLNLRNTILSERGQTSNYNTV